MEKIIYKQLDITLKNWGGAIAKFFPSDLVYWNNADKHLEAHQQRWNLMNAVDFIKGYAKGKKQLKCLDLGCGTGWLAAQLSSLEEVAYVDAVDSDDKMLQQMLPQIVEKLSGNLNKVRPVHGLFTPILTTPEGGYNFICMSSAAHHHDNIFELMEELEKAVAKGGYIFLLNEVPIPDWKYRFRLLHFGARALYHTFTMKQKSRGQGLYMNGLLYDPVLGDISYSDKQWQKILGTAKSISWKRVDTGLSSYKSEKGLGLVHFVGVKK